LTDKEREKQYIESFVNDLKADTASIHRAIRSNLRREKLLDSILMTSNTDLTVPANAKQLVKLFMLATYRPSHTPASISISQLKNTGSFRLLKKGVVDSLLVYDKANEGIIRHNDFYSDDLNTIWESFYPICDVKIFRDTSFATYNANTRTLTDKSIPTLHLSQEKLSVFTGHITRQVLINAVNRSMIETQLVRATHLLAFLEKTYHLE
jgi:hypothetical protein